MAAQAMRMPADKFTRVHKHALEAAELERQLKGVFAKHGTRKYAELAVSCELLF